MAHVFAPPHASTVVKKLKHANVLIYVLMAVMKLAHAAVQIPVKFATVLVKPAAQKTAAMAVR